MSSVASRPECIARVWAAQSCLSRVGRTRLKC